MVKVSLARRCLAKEENGRDTQRNAEQRQRNEEKSIARNSKGDAWRGEVLLSKGRETQSNAEE